MTSRLHRAVKVVSISVTAGLIGLGLWYVPRWLQHWLVQQAEATASLEPCSPVKLVDGEPDTLRLPPEVVAKLGIRTATVQPSTQSKVLELSGTLLLDASRMSRVHPRFSGEIVEMGQATDQSRPLQVGDAVEQGQLLAVMWSRELGEKKSELVDVLSQLRLDQQNLSRLEHLIPEGAVAERSVRDSQRQVESDRIAVARVVRTLQTWRIPEEDITTVREEAQRLAEHHEITRGELVQQWARLEVKSPAKGMILERNAVRGDLVNTDLDLFVIADVSRLQVLAHAYEEDLPELLALSVAQRQWKVRIQADAAAGSEVGGFEQIGQIVDPNQHTALVTGWLDNRAGRWRAGQFVNVEIALPRPTDEAQIPATALIDDGKTHTVFVQPDANDARFSRREVSVARQDHETDCVHVRLTESPLRQSQHGVAVGERVVSSGVVELTGALREAQAAAASTGK